MTRIPDSHRGRSDAFAAAMSRSAEKRQCPSYKRKSALQKVETEHIRAMACRWCGYARGRDLQTGNSFVEEPHLPT